MSEHFSQETLPLPPRTRTLVVEDVNPVASKPEVELTPELIGVELPSKFHFYPFKSISIRPIKGIHQAKFTRAAAENSYRHVLDAVSSLLPKTVSAYDLTLQDFYWVLYYLRTTNYLKTPMIHRSVCTSLDHLKKVQSGEFDNESLVTVTTVTKTSLQETTYHPSMMAVSEPFAEDSAFTRFNVELSYPRAGDLVELDDFLSDTTNELSEHEKEFLSEHASFIRGLDSNGKPLSLVARTKVIEEMTPDELKVIVEYGKSVSNYGVNETLTTSCGKCGAEIKTEVSISAYSFL